MDTKTVETLLEKAAEANQGSEAMHFSQAAVNAAQTLRMMAELARLGPAKS